MQPAPLKPNKDNELAKYRGLQPAPHEQYILDLDIEIQKDVNGIEMGVLQNGIPFLTQRGLAKISGAARIGLI